MRTIQIILTVIFFILMMGCNKSSSTGPDYGFNDDLIANWFLLSYEDEDGLQEYSGFLNIAEQKTFVGQFVDEDGTYNFSGTIETTSTSMKMNITDSDALWIEEGIYTLAYEVSANSLTIEGTVDEEDIRVVYTKESPGDGEGTFSGIVRSAGKDPLENALVALQNTQFNTYTDLSGNFMIEDIPVGTYTAQISKADYSSHNASIEILNNENTYAIYELEVESGGNGSISGFVGDVFSQIAVQGAMIEVLDTNFTGTSSSEGTYYISNVPTGEYSVKCSKPGFEEQTLSNIIVSVGEEAYANFMLLPEGYTDYGSIVGTVTNAAYNAPIPNVSINIDDLFYSITFPDGSYQFEAIPEGTYGITFSKPGYQDQTISNVQVNVDQDVNLDVAMVQIDGAGSLTVAVRSNLGVILPGVLVEIVDTEFSSTTVAGICIFSEIPSGMYTVKASKIGYTTQYIDNVEILADVPQYLDITLH